MGELLLNSVKTAYNLQHFFKQTLSAERRGSATPLYEFKEPFKKLFPSQNAFLIISSEEEKEKEFLEQQKKS